MLPLAINVDGQLLNISCEQLSRLLLSVKLGTVYTPPTVTSSDVDAREVIVSMDKADNKLVPVYSDR